MDIAKVQNWVKEHFGDTIDGLPTEYGVARLLTQAGQLGEAVLHEGDVGKEIADVMFVLAALANRAGVDMNEAIEKNLTGKTPEEFMARIDKR